MSNKKQQKYTNSLGTYCSVCINSSAIGKEYQFILVASEFFNSLIRVFGLELS